MRSRLCALGVSTRDDLVSLMATADEFVRSAKPILVVTADRTALWKALRCTACILAPFSDQDVCYFVCDIPPHISPPRGGTRSKESFLRLLRRQYGLYHLSNRNDRQFEQTERQLWLTFVANLVQAAHEYDVPIPPSLHAASLIC